jgi:hypothetical protein
MNWKQSIYIATRDIYPNEEIFVAYGAAYWVIQQGLSMEKAIQAKRNYNLPKLTPYHPESSSTAKLLSQADPQDRGNNPPKSSSR